MIEDGIFCGQGYFVKTITILSKMVEVGPAHAFTAAAAGISSGKPGQAAPAAVAGKAEPSPICCRHMA